MPKLPVPKQAQPPADEVVIEGQWVAETLPVLAAPTLPAAAPGVTMPASFLSEALDLGHVFAASGMFPDVQSAAQAVVKICAGRAYGIDPFQAMTGIYVVQGRVTLSANLLAALVKRSGKYDYRVSEHTELACVIDFYHAGTGELIGTSPFTIKDAQAAGLVNRPVWKAYPRNMLFARAMSNGVRWFCPDLTYSPVYTPEEVDANFATIKELEN